MALFDRNREPGQRELNVFGAMLALFFLIAGGLFWWRTGSTAIAAVFWILATLLAIFYYVFPSIRRPTYRIAVNLTYPIGWVIWHLMLVMIYFGWITPAGLLIRLFGRDPMGRRLDRSAGTYWVPRKPTTDVDRYFRQS